MWLKVTLKKAPGPHGVPAEFYITFKKPENLMYPLKNRKFNLLKTECYLYYLRI